ncbi:selenate reductase [Blautia sp. 2744]|uniref:Selenate reductase n=1 Tax=Blautia intestinalis TaxID=2763028 RepID=A0ABR7I110_9FIRM|nr:selenate reductase [Blautia intestinalis]MBC5740187.1 selenate reductase [Blautia intestinalis]RHD33093.1 selenate reductase [Blautia obeum]
MSDIMKSIPFGQLTEWILNEYKKTGQVFGIQKAYVADQSKTIEIFGRKLENPVGPAAGPHTQLAQNLVAAYVAGARFFELKTVQKMDGPELSACIPKPCIVAEDEAYNCEWSTELYVPQAMAEYIKGWILIHVIAKEFGLGSPDGFQFNMSCGYNLEGIKDKKIDDFIEGLKDAGDTAIFKECKQWLLEHISLFEHVTKEDIEAVPAEICNSITLSTMHGCPPQEIENIVTYLLKEKHINTYVKCNPTLLGYEFVRKAMDDLGYDYMAFTDFHFKDDLQYEDAVPMLKRLLETASQEGLSFGVKLTNTFPVDIKRQELPGEEMYMSGKALFPLSISVASRLAESFDGKLPMSFSGGADQKNIDQIVGCGIWPVTVATVLLKPGGYKWLTRIAEKADTCEIGKCGEVQVETLKKLAEDSLTDAHYQKTVKKAAAKQTEEKSPLLDCLKKKDAPKVKEFTRHKRVCGNCADVCPNRANVLIEVPEMELLQILHIDYMCNECGNCRSFCQYAGAPYKDKFTLFATEEDMEDSTNNGFTVLDAETKEVLVRIGDRQEKVKADQPSEILNEDLGKLICTVINDYTYLFM